VEEISRRDAEVAEAFGIWDFEQKVVCGTLIVPSFSTAGIVRPGRPYLRTPATGIKKVTVRSEQNHVARPYVVRFSLRHAFVLLTVSCLAAAFLCPILIREEQQRSRIGQLHKLGVLYHYDTFDEWGWARFLSTHGFAEAIVHLRESRDPVNGVYIDGQSVSAQMLAYLGELPSVTELDLRNGRVDGSKILLPHVTHLNLVGTQCDWNVLNGFPNLEVLAVDVTQMSSELIERINGCPELRALTVESVNSVENIRPDLLELRHLRSISLMGATLRSDDPALEEIQARFNVGINGHWRRKEAVGMKMK
jgi:hypothetical protein